MSYPPFIDLKMVFDVNPTFPFHELSALDRSIFCIFVIYKTPKATNFDYGPSLLHFQFMSYPPFIDLKMVFDLLFLYYVEYLDETSQIC